MKNKNQYVETMSHLFQECTIVSDLSDSFCVRLTGQEEFVFSRREFLATFKRNDLSFA
jgi:hypothetical protein